MYDQIDAILYKYQMKRYEIDCISSDQGVVVMANIKAKVRTADKALTDQLASTANLSQRIRLLHAAGWSKGDIARFLTEYEKKNHARDKEVRFQHVRNVIITPLKSS